MEMPEERTVPLRRRDLFTERRTDLAMAVPDFFLNTPPSRSMALLVDCTCATQRRCFLLMSDCSPVPRKLPTGSVATPFQLQRGNFRAAQELVGRGNCQSLADLQAACIDFRVGGHQRVHA